MDEEEDLAGEESESSDESKSEFQRSIEEAFPGETWDEARLAALKDAIHQCVEGYPDGDEKPASSIGKAKPGPIAVLAFGKPGKK